MAKLMERQRRFAQAWLRVANGTRAAIEAGYSPRSAHVQACRLLKNAQVLQEMKILRDAQEAESRLQRDDLLDRLEEARELAIEYGRPQAALEAIELTAKLSGALGKAAELDARRRLFKPR